MKDRETLRREVGDMIARAQGRPPFPPLIDALAAYIYQVEIAAFREAITTTLAEGRGVEPTTA